MELLLRATSKFFGLPRQYRPSECKLFYSATTNKMREIITYLDEHFANELSPL